MARTLVIAIAILICHGAQADSPDAHDAHDAPNDIGIGFGLLQPIVLSGFNAEIDAHTRHWSFDYSHGASLDESGGLVVGAAHDQHLAYHLPYSTGLGIGYRITRALDLRLEPKLHSWEVYYDGMTQTAANRIAAYKVFTLGVGLYYRWFPFGGRRDWVRGFTVVASARYWPNVYDTLGTLTYQNRVTGKSETLTAASIGIANTPFFVNVTLGYAVHF